MRSALRTARSVEPHAVTLRTGERLYEKPAPAFTIIAADRRIAERIESADAYEAAVAFIRGDIDVAGDLVAAIRWKSAATPHGLLSSVRAKLARFAAVGAQYWFQSRGRAAANIQYHYDASDDFYRLFLDARMVYSCAYFKERSWSLEQAQAAKLEYICRKLDVQPRERFLDIGCGWGALVLHAAAKHAAITTGCTLSRNQFETARERARDLGLESSVTILQTDYRDLQGSYDKISSVGMFEHVGRKRIRQYFETCYRLLAPGGLFLNHSVIRPQTVKETAETVFWTKQVFPGAQTVPLSEVIRAAEEAGFETLDVENLRSHYALTCRAWADALRRNEAEAVRLVGRRKYRSWLLLFAGASAAFEEGQTDLCQVLFAKRSHPQPRKLTRDHMRL
jgi:cyclopropane-fatty-acyl-phospholipid synthase